MGTKGPDKELRARDPENLTDPNTATYKVYARGRLRGAIVPIEPQADGSRWKALDLKGNTTFWRFRDAARDHLCDMPSG